MLTPLIKLSIEHQMVSVSFKLMGVDRRYMVVGVIRLGEVVISDRRLLLGHNEGKVLYASSYEQPNT